MLKLIGKIPPGCQKEAKADRAPGGIFTRAAIFAVKETFTI